MAFEVGQLVAVQADGSDWIARVVEVRQTELLVHAEGEAATSWVSASACRTVS